MTDAELISLLPHEPPMVLITDGEILSPGEATAFADCSSESLFFDESLGGIPGTAALEFMAQTMALSVGAHSSGHGDAPKIGFVLGSRRLSVRVPVFCRDRRYRVHVVCDYTDDEFASFNCTIEDETGAVVADGRLTAFQSSDGQVPERVDS